MEGKTDKELYKEFLQGNKESFEKLDIIQQIEFVNEKLKEGYSLSRLAKEGITSAPSTMRDRYERVHYKYNKDTKQFENIVEIMPSVNDEICVTKDDSNKVGEDMRIMLNDAINSLKDKEKLIIYKRYFEGITQLELSEAIGISQAQISRIEKNGLESIKKLIR